MKSATGGHAESRPARAFPMRHYQAIWYRLSKSESPLGSERSGIARAELRSRFVPDCEGEATIFQQE